jgi:hypothetical protein
VDQEIEEHSQEEVVMLQVKRERERESARVKV